MDAIREFLLWVLTLAGVRFIAAHTIINVVVAVAAALKVGEFKLHKLADFLVKKLAPYVLVYAAVKFIGAEAGLAWLAVAAFTLIEATLLADLAENLELLGIPLPGAASKLVSKDNSVEVELIDPYGGREWIEAKSDAEVWSGDQ